jgi:hypothetical protein
MIDATRIPSRRPAFVCVLTLSMLALGLASPLPATALDDTDRTTLGEQWDDIRYGGNLVIRDLERLRTPYEHDGTWGAYFRDSDGKDWTVLEPMEQYDDETWMDLRFSEFRGNRLRLAVWWNVDTITPEPAKLHWGDTTIYASPEEPVQAIEGLLTTALFNTHRFDLVERQRVGAILEEQEFGSKHTTETSAARIGETLGVDYLLLVEVNETNHLRRWRGLWLGLGQKVTEITISFKVVDTETGRVIFADTTRGRAANRQLGNRLLGLGSDSPLHYAVMSSVNRMAYRLAMSLPIEPWKGSVVDVHGPLVAVNGGFNRGLEPGMKLLAIDRGRELRDPESGEVLGHREEVIGSVRVTAVQPFMATAVVVEGCEGLQLGDFVRLEEDAVSAGLVVPDFDAPGPPAPDEEAAAP